MEVKHDEPHSAAPCSHFYSPTLKITGFTGGSFYQGFLGVLTEEQDSLILLFMILAKKRERKFMSLGLKIRNDYEMLNKDG